jgi:hypothetical protein
MLGEIQLKERKKGDHIFLQCNIRCVASSIPTHHLHLLFPFLPQFTTPFSIEDDYLPHKLFRIFLCYYNIHGVA